MRASLPTLLPYQTALVERPFSQKIFLEGPAGSGKTTAATARLVRMLEQGIPGNTILVVLPQRTLGNPYYQALSYSQPFAGGIVSIVTLGGLAQRMIDLFWPVIGEAAGFAHPDDPPVFLTLETAQYYMAHLVRPLLDGGMFDGVTIGRNRLYSQIIDNLNKAAVVGFPHTEIGERLSNSLLGDPAQLRIFQDAQECANRFRSYCLENNLLDFSLQVEVFRDYLWTSPLCRAYLQRTYHHLIFDNLEEDTPFTHQVLDEWLPDFASALLIYDDEAGFRRFLGADPETGYELRESCDERLRFDNNLVSSRPVQALASNLRTQIHPGSQAENLFIPKGQVSRIASSPPQDPRPAVHFEYLRYYPEMLDWTVDQITFLVQEKGIPPGEIAVLAPFLSDALRFALIDRLRERGVEARSHRPSRSLREEPAAQCMLTLAALAHPQWGLRPTRFDVAYALVQSIHGMDLVRAHLLAEIVYRIRDGAPTLGSFDAIIPATQDRITYLLGTRYESLRSWLLDIQAEPELPLDHFFSRLFGEVLSQPGFGFHGDLTAGEIPQNLIESAQKFRWMAGDALQQDGRSLGKEYLLMVADGVIAAQFVRSWQVKSDEAVLLAPAYTFLMANRPVDIQFWLDVGSRGWTERLYQPLTHPYVLTREWLKGRAWTEGDEANIAQEALSRLTQGLLRRCRQGIYLGLSELNEQGYEDRGPLLRVFQHIFQQYPAQERNEAL